MMTVILVFTIFLIISILIWVFFGSRDDEHIRKKEVLAQSQEKVLRRRAADKEIEDEGQETAGTLTDENPQYSSIKFHRKKILKNPEK